jgi:hypothetical protein
MDPFAIENEMRRAFERANRGEGRASNEVFRYQLDEEDSYRRPDVSPVIDARASLIAERRLQNELNVARNRSDQLARDRQALAGGEDVGGVSPEIGQMMRAMKEMRNEFDRMREENIRARREYQREAEEQRREAEEQRRVEGELRAENRRMAERMLSMERQLIEEGAKAIGRSEIRALDGQIQAANAEADERRRRLEEATARSSRAAHHLVEYTAACSRADFINDDCPAFAHKIARRLDWAISPESSGRTSSLSLAELCSFNTAVCMSWCWLLVL